MASDGRAVRIQPRKKRGLGAQRRDSPPRNYPRPERIPDDPPTLRLKGIEVTIEEFIAAMTDRGKPAAPQAVEAFEREIGEALPEDYRRFLAECDGGYVAGRLAFGAGPDCVAVNHVGGLQRREYAFSLRQRRRIFQGAEPRIPRSVIWIMDDPLGNAVCLGIAGAERGRVYFWDHEDAPDPEEWDGEAETAGNLRLLAGSFTELVAGLREFDDEEP